MFDGLRKKFSNFVESLTKKEEQKVEEETKKEEAAEPKRAETAPAPAHAAPAREEKHAEPEEPVRQQRAAEEIKPEPEQVPEKDYEKKPEPRAERPRVQEQPRRVEERRQEAPVIKPKISLGTKLRGVIFREVKVSEKDVEPFIEQLKISLIQSDVNYEVVERMTEKIQTELTSNPIDSRNLSGNIAMVIRKSIFDILNKGTAVDLLNLAAKKKASGEPLKILFIGPNGAGKTTTMAKIANLMLKNNFTCVMSASDTFRAAAVEQTAYHAGKLGIGVIKGRYGADPASVAFDAIAHAKAHKVDVVLIDSAGRQETNKSLMEEIKKMVRIAQPDLKIFIGESIVGNALLNQVREFNQAVGLDGIILTKLDADAKGGNTLSILSETDVPILFFGIGEAYDKLMPYDPEFIVDNIMPVNN